RAGMPSQIAPQISTLLGHLETFRRFRRDVAYIHYRGLRRERWTYARVLQVANQLAHELETRQIGKGDHVILWGNNCAEWVAAFFGCMLRGAVAVPLDRIGSADFTARVAQQVRAKLLVGSVALGNPTSIDALALEDLAQTVARHSDQ